MHIIINDHKYPFHYETSNRQKGADFIPHVSLEDGIAAVEMGMKAQANISNKAEEEKVAKPLVAFSTKSSEHLMNLAIDVAKISITPKHSIGEYEQNLHVGEEKGL